ncbi:hypothetical protein C0995_008110 [Termitomyces sp. Mi166|nr:hypothetical protein C0995_008110 [Termitomyces sp. Mi166\
MFWNVVIFGPAPTPTPTADTPLEDGTFKLILTFDRQVPLANGPPRISGQALEVTDETASTVCRLLGTR